MGDIADEMVFAEQSGFADPENFLITGYPGQGNGYWDRPHPLDPGFGYGLPITAVRGGIKYPTPKERTMPRSKAQIAKEIQTAHDTVQALNQHMRELREELRKAGPDEPRSGRISVSVWFSPRGKRYEFLMIRPPGSAKWFSTGTKPETREFRNWQSVLDWLNGPDVHNWGHLDELARVEKIEIR